MTRIVALALASTFIASTAMAQETPPQSVVVQANPVATAQGLGALGTTTTLAIVGGVVLVGILIASGDDSSSSTSTTN